MVDPLLVSPLLELPDLRFSALEVEPALAVATPKARDTGEGRTGATVVAEPSGSGCLEARSGAPQAATSSSNKETATYPVGRAIDLEQFRWLELKRFFRLPW